MDAFIISIGEELLIGQTINTNAAWMAAQLNTAGIEVKEIRVITDRHEEILDTLKAAADRADLVLITGGLGPTRDDVTRDVLCTFFDAELVMNRQVLDDITVFFKQRGRTITDINRNQAMVPDKARIIRNPYGTAPGFWFTQAGKSFIAMPGVPYEMKEMVSKHVLPALLEKEREKYIVHKSVLTHGIGESYLVDLIGDWENNLPEEIQLAYLPSVGIVKLRLSAKGKNEERLREIIDREVEALKRIIPEYIWGFDSDTLEGVVGSLLRERGKTVCTAESCTGGYIAHRITSIPGSSAYFSGSIVAYGNQIKTGLLHIPQDLLESFGAVSKETAENMAESVLKLMNSDYAVGVTGIAGPDGGSEEKPVGTTWIAVSSQNKTFSHKYQFGDNRERNIIRASNAALAMLRELINES
ncbi:MAG: competence/damage-inducible protein A [Bacteroidia bacterium]|nr:MAG: competence/damage-inducible protein A [Bacteroidia bacterium]